MTNKTLSSDTNIRPFDTIDERDLHAYIDGHLDARRRQQVEAYLARNPEMSAEIQDYMTYNQLLGEAGSAIEQAPVPPHLLNTLNRTAPVRNNRWAPATKAAAVVALCCLSAAGGWSSAVQMQSGPANTKMTEAARDSVPDKPRLGPDIEATPGKQAVQESQKKLATGGQNTTQRPNTRPGNSSIDTQKIKLPTRIMQP
jgi:anti-sigma factor RsiW